MNRRQTRMANRKSQIAGARRDSPTAPGRRRMRATFPMFHHSSIPSEVPRRHDQRMARCAKQSQFVGPTAREPMARRAKQSQFAGATARERTARRAKQSQFSGVLGRDAGPSCETKPIFPRGRCLPAAGGAALGGGTGAHVIRRRRHFGLDAARAGNRLNNLRVG